MILEVSELSKEFVTNDKIIHAVDRVSFRIVSGEFVSLIGHSGSGKSTLFHLITGMQKPTSGQITLDDVCINSAGIQKLTQIRNETIGFLLQEQNLLKNFTVLENVLLPNLVGTSKKRINIKEKAEEILNRVGIWKLRNSFPDEISGGEARRVAIARALINEPSLIIADEPTSSLDPDNGAKIMLLLKTISESGAAVLISTHNMQFLEHSDKVFRMNSGRLNRIERSNRYGI